MQIRQQNKHVFGFSLIELLVVISIIGVLSAVLVANFMEARERAKDTQKIEDLNSIKTALRMYYNDNQSYPIDQNDLVSGVGTSNYMPSLSNIGFTYNYTQKNNGDGFIITTILESGAGDEDIQSQNKCGIGASNKIFAVCAN